MKCLHCQQETSNPKFCSKSCAASYNNTGKRRHGKAPGVCEHCGNPKASVDRKYCSQTCSAAARKDPEQVKISSRIRQARYRAKHGFIRAFAPDADREKIKLFYYNCPVGYEVDHIIPLSKGGLHHENNLQYLTIKENRSKGNRIVE